MSDNTDQQKQKRCMILTIAPELRNRIYDKIFKENDTVTVDEDYCLPGVLKTCKMIHNEAISMYYARTTFEYTHTHLPFGSYRPRPTSDQPAPIIANWLRPLPPKYRLLLKKIRYYSEEINDQIEIIEKLRAEKLPRLRFETTREYSPECDARGTGIKLDDHFIMVDREMTGLIAREKVEVPWMPSEPLGELRCWRSLVEIDEYFAQGWWMRGDYNTGVYWV